MPSSGFIALLIVLITTARWFWLAYKVDIPKQTKPFAIGWATGAALGLISVILFSGGAAAGWAIALGGLFFYFVTTGAQKVAEQHIAVGDKIPAFQALDDKGEMFDSAELAGHPLLLKFFRGHW